MGDDIVVKGVATDGSVDSDSQIVDAEWSAKALAEWLATGGNVRMSHDPQRPVGKGLQVEVDRDGDGKHWVKSLIVDPVAQRLVEKGVLTAYSVGISRPVIKRDPTGKARNGIICGGELCELSIVDRPSNKSSYLEIAKAASDGTAEFTGKVFGDADTLTKADKGQDESGVEKSSDGVAADAGPQVAEKRDVDPDVGGGVDRDNLPDSDFVFPDERVFPVPTPGDVSDAASSWGRYKGSKSFDEFKSKLTALARRKGPTFVAELPQSWKDEMASKSETEPDVAKGKKDCTNCGKTYHADSKLRTCESCGSDLPNADDADKAAEPGAEKKCKTCGGTGTIREGHMDCPSCAGDKAGKAADAEAVKSDDDDDDEASDDGGQQDDDADDDDGDDQGDDKPAKKAAKLPQCTSCGADCPLDAKFCPMCGLDTAAMKPAAKSAKPTCTKCGMKAKKNAKFCSNCGESLSNVTKRGKPVVDDGHGHRADPVPEHREPDGPQTETFEEDAGMEDGDAAAERAAARHKSSGAGHALGTLHDLTCAAFPPHGTLGDAIDLGVWSDQAVKATTSGNLEEAAKALSLMGHAKTLKNADPADLAAVRDDLHKGFSTAYPDAKPTPATVIPGRLSRPYLTEGHARPSAGQHDPTVSVKVPPEAPHADEFERGPLTEGHADPSPSTTADPMRPSSSNPARVYYTNASREAARSAMLAMHDHIATTFPDLCPMAGTRDDISTASASKTAEPEVAKAAEEPGSGEQTSAEAVPPEPAVEAAETVTKVHGGTQAEPPPEFISKAAALDLVKAHTADLIKSLGDQIGDLRAHFDDQISELRRSVEEMAAEPDPRQAPWRGVAVQKSSNATVQPVERRSLFDEAAAARRDALVLQLQDQRLNSPHPAEREQARKALAEMLATP